MKRVDNPTAVGSKPAYSAGPNPNSYFSEGLPGVDDGTVPGQDWCNQVQEELCNAITDDGASLDGSLDNQLATRLSPLKALKSDASDTTSVTTSHLRGVLASSLCRASGVASAAVASAGVTVAGDASGSLGCGGTSSVAGDQAAAVASIAVTVSGDRAGTLGSYSGEVSGDQAADVAGYGNTVSGDQAGAFASREASVSGNQAATLACGASAEPVAVEKPKSAAIGCADSFISTDGGSNFGHSLLLGSPNCELADDFTIAAGYSASTPTQSDVNQNLVWRVELDNLGEMSLNGGAYNTTGADYAEFFANAETGVLPPGAIVAGVGAKLKLAGPGDRVRGVVSATPSLVGNAAVLGWSGRYKVDEWGRRSRVEHENGMTDFEEADGYDPSKPYVERRARPEEWTPVALTGQVLVRVDATVKVGDMVGPGQGGVGTELSGLLAPKGRPIECMEIRSPFELERGFAIALCLVG